MAPLKDERQKLLSTQYSINYGNIEYLSKEKAKHTLFKTITTESILSPSSSTKKKKKILKKVLQAEIVTSMIPDIYLSPHT